MGQKKRSRDRSESTFDAGHAQQKLVPNSREHWYFSALFVLVFVLLACGYFWLAWVTTGRLPALMADVIDRLSIFRVDDAYRFYISKLAWRELSVYAWNYMLPVCVFLDGLLVSLVGGDLFLARCTHIVPALMTLWCIYMAGRGLGVGRVLMLLSTLVLAVMPLYVFVFLSFYGENWLTLFASASLCAFVYKRYFLVAVIAAFMPLIRAEGLFLIFPLFLFFLKERQFKNFLILIAPGALHFLSLFFILDNFMDYFTWRVKFRQVSNTVYSGDVYENYMLSTFSPFWTLPAIVAFMMTGMRQLWPIWAGACLWLVWVSASLMLNQFYYEPRYLLSVLPVITVGWALFISTFSKTYIFSVARKGWVIAFSMLLAFIVIEHGMQLDPLKARYGMGARWPFPGTKVLVPEFSYYSRDDAIARKNIASAIYGIIDKNPQVDALVVYSDNIFRVLNPARINPRVRVSLAPMSGNISLDAAGNNFYAMHPDARQYALYHFQTLDRSKTTKVVLYVGELGCQLCTPVYSSGGYFLYAFAYDVSYDMKQRPQDNVSLDCKKSAGGELVCRRS